MGRQGIRLDLRPGGCERSRASVITRVLTTVGEVPRQIGVGEPANHEERSKQAHARA
jgi:hypothetical protein